ELRARLGKPERPAVAIVTSGASLDVSHPVVAEGALVLTTERGAAALAVDVANVVAVGGGDWVDLRAALELLRARGHEHVLAEAHVAAARGRPPVHALPGVRLGRGPCVTRSCLAPPQAVPDTAFRKRCPAPAAR